jgi:hypothetical protein
VKNLNDVKWDEHFSIEYYDKKEKESFFQVEVYGNGKLLGCYRQNMDEIGGANGAWENAETKECLLKSSSGTEMGNITLRIRREEKCIGQMDINIKCVELNGCQQCKSAKCVVNLSTFSHECSSAEGKCEGNVCKFCFNDNVKIDIDEKNNVFDAFIEVWDVNCGQSQQGVNNKPKNAEQKHPGCLIGQARLPIYDCRKRFEATLPILSQSQDHKLMGSIKLDAELKQDRTKKKIQEHKKNKN